jgi:ATP/maltotriose-dependent transcriptional regulator MalT
VSRALSDLLSDAAFVSGHTSIAVAAAEEALALAREADLPVLVTWSAISLAVIAVHTGAQRTTRRSVRRLR